MHMIEQEINQIETGPIISPGWEINNIGIKYPAGSSEHVFLKPTTKVPGRFKGYGNSGFY